MADCKTSKLMEIQILWELHRDKWDPMKPEYARNTLL